MGFSRHGRFYVALLVGVVLAAVLPGSNGQRIIIGADALSAVYLALMLRFAGAITPDLLRSRAADADEGVPVILLIALAVIAMSLAAVFLTFSAASKANLTEVSLALAGLPLGWAMLQTLMAFHYAHVFYGPRGKGGKAGGLKFEGTAEPGVWDFLYYAFTVGMTAQVSDTIVTTTAMRRVTLGHAVLSFLYNTVILALAVNAAVSLHG